MAIIQIPVLFDMSGDTLVFGEEISGEFISSHLDFLLDMTTEANDISLNAADISSAILVGDQDDGDNIFYSGGETSNIAVDNLCNRIAKSITRGKLVHTPKTGNSSNSGIPMGGRLYVVGADGQEEVPPDGQYAAKYLHSIAPIGDEQMLGEAMARVTSVHLMGTPLAAAILVDKNSVQSDLETASAQTFNSGNTAFYNALAVQLSKVLGGSKSSAPMNNGGGSIGYHPLDASGVSVPALKSIYEQLMNVPGRSQIMQTRDISGVVDNSNVTVASGFPFISGDKLVMYLRPKIQFAAQTQAEDNNALYTFNYTGKTILAIPAYSISDKTGIITTQTYTHSSSQNSTSKIFEHSTDGNGIIGAEFWHSATNSYNNTTGVHEGANANGATTNVDIATPPPATTTTHTVTVGDNGGNKFKIDGAFNPILAFVKGNTYIFDQSDGTNSGHQIQISETSGGANTSYATTVGTPGTAGAKTTVVVPSNAPATLYYNCNPHGAGMGNSIGVTSPPNSISGEWGQVDIGENTWATELKLTSNNGNNDSPPREFRLLGSTNGTNWITLIHETEAGPWADQVTQTFPIVTQGSYRYYRYIVIKCYNAVSAGNINSQTTIGHFNLRGAKHPSETAENSDLAFMKNSPLDISGLQTNVVSASTSVQSAFPGNATNGPEAEAGKWGWMGSANSDSFTLDSTDFVDPRTIDLHIWKITITL